MKPREPKKLRAEAESYFELFLTWLKTKTLQQIYVDWFRPSASKLEHPLCMYEDRVTQHRSPNSFIGLDPAFRPHESNRITAIGIVYGECVDCDELVTSLEPIYKEIQQLAIKNTFNKTARCPEEIITKYAEWLDRLKQSKKFY